ncbi:MAG: DUF2520 domain-containing protein [Rubricoccaceae bacterium]|nr:DUF2520 domain-containing protein [Rubricoccaceae bacterium]
MSAYASAFKDARPAVALIGAGAMGRALALRLNDRGYPVLGVVSRTRAKAEALAQAVGAPVASDRLLDLPPEARLVFLCVGDGAIADVAESLTGVRHAWRETVVVHCSGALPAAALEPLVQEGAAALSFHPLQAISPDADARALDGAYVGLEGDPKAVAAGIELAVGLGLRYLVLTPEAKPRYHLAATLASNFLVTLLGMVQEVLVSLDIDRADGFALIEPLLRGTLDNLAHLPPEEALTGPVVRGDLETLRRHGLALRQHLPQLVPAYAALTVESVRLAVRSGRLDPAHAEDVLSLMQRLVTTPLPTRNRGRAPQAEPSGPRPAQPRGSEPV